MEYWPAQGCWKLRRSTSAAGTWELTLTLSSRCLVSEKQSPWELNESQPIYLPVWVSGTLHVTSQTQFCGFFISTTAQAHRHTVPPLNWTAVPSLAQFDPPLCKDVSEGTSVNSCGRQWWSSPASWLRGSRDVNYETSALPTCKSHGGKAAFWPVGEETNVYFLIMQLHSPAYFPFGKADKIGTTRSFAY